MGKRIFDIENGDILSFLNNDNFKTTNQIGYVLNELLKVKKEFKDYLESPIPEGTTNFEIYKTIRYYILKISRLRSMCEPNFEIRENIHTPSGVKYVVLRTPWIDDNGDKVRISTNLGPENKIKINGKIPESLIREGKETLIRKIWKQYLNVYSKNDITESQLKELKPKSKDLIGKETNNIEHEIFPSKRFPDRVYKVGPPRRVDAWYYLFVSRPDLFPIVYKKGYIPYNFNGEELYYYYVLLEKLDTKKALMHYDMVDAYFRKNKFPRFEMWIIGIEDGDENLRPIMTKMYKEDPKLFEIFERFYILIDQVYELKPGADLHKYQFGYDKLGNLKCLDL